jgi:hypothetical protein
MDRVSFDAGWVQFKVNDDGTFALFYYAEMEDADGSHHQPLAGDYFPAGFTTANKTTLRNILGVLAGEIAKEALGAAAVTRTGKTFVES